MDETNETVEERTPEIGLGEADTDLLARIAGWVVERRMAVPAILFLESHRPLSFLGSQALIMASPVVSAVEPFFRGLLGKGFSYDDYRRFAELMENRENVEELIVSVERENQRVRDLEREEKRRKKALKREARQRRKELQRASRAGSDRGDS